MSSLEAVETTTSDLCLRFDSQLDYYSFLSAHGTAASLSVTLGLFAIIKYYWQNSNNFNPIMTFCTISYMISDIFECVGFIFAANCERNEFKNEFTIADICTLIGGGLSGLGYISLYFIFVYRLKITFSDSIFEISNTKINLLRLLGIIGFILAIIFIIIIRIICCWHRRCYY